MASGDAQLTPMQTFYAGSKVLLTGATGMLGSVLLEKLLRACHVDTVYVVVRARRGVSAEARVHQLLAAAVFDRLRDEQPDFQQRVVTIAGDCSAEQLGLTASQRDLLQANVQFVFHCAALVNFKAGLRDATLMNVRGTRELLVLATSMRHLRFITHVSTACVHPIRDVLDERFYSTPFTAHQLITLAEQLPEQLLEQLEPSIMASYPNSYIFTKSVAEQLIEEHCDLPIAVYRPAVLATTFREPLPGWINNIHGPQGLISSVLIGILHTLNCDGSVHANFVPTDMCANGLLAVAFHASAHKLNARIYHFESNSVNPTTFGDIHNAVITYAKKAKRGFFCFLQLRKNHFSNMLATILLHYVPALCYDFVLRCVGRTPWLLRAYGKIHSLTSSLAYFYAKSWRYDSTNYLAMCDSLSEDDAQLFFCDLRAVDWSTFLTVYVDGCKRYLVDRN